MGLILYDNPASSNAMKVRFLLAELRLKYEHRHIPLPKPRPPAYMERYRFGAMPFLQADDVELGESNAILCYLANPERPGDLYPSDPLRRAKVDWALDAWSTQLRGGFFRLSALG